MIIFLTAIFCFTITLLIMPFFLSFLKKADLTVKDLNKENKPLLPSSGGLAVLFSISFTTITFVYFNVFFLGKENKLLFFFTYLLTIFLITLIGFIDDVFILKSKNSSCGLSNIQKPLLTLVTAVPLMALKHDDTFIFIPFLGSLDIGILYPLCILPFFIGFPANAVNLLAGLNGLEAGMGIVYMGMLAIYTYVNNIEIGFFISLITFSALVVFYFYNKFPAKILPGNSLTYLLGASLASIAVLGNLKTVVMIILIPFAIEFVLKARSKFKAQSYGYYDNGKVRSLHYQNIYSLIHIFTRTGHFTEKQIVLIFIAIELFFSSLIWFV
ncbi:MAG: hypothetical protein ABIA04_00585 [Pseudomonadota bacterium]